MYKSNLSDCQLINNSIVLEKIFRNLKLKDQLKLIHVCREFHDTLVQFVWRSTCKDLKVNQQGDHYFVNCNGSEICCMKEKEVGSFLNLNRFNVQRLTLSHCTNAKLFRITGEFANLIALKILHCKISIDTIERLAKNCHDLKTLILDHCSCDHCHEDLVLDQQLKIETLARISSLRELRIVTPYSIKTNYESLIRIVNKMNLTKLSINSSLVAKSIKRCEDLIPSKLENLQHLDFGKFSNRKAWLLFEELHLPDFTNLQSLALFIDLDNCVFITDTTLKDIANSCPRLQKLSFKECKFRTEHFILSPSLSHLSLIWCKGLTWQHFYEMLHEYSLQTFDTINCYYDGHVVGLFNRFHTLQTLTVETYIIESFPEILDADDCSFPQVTTLNWLNSDESTLNENTKRFSQLFPQLETLHLERAYLPIEEFQQLSCLHTLKISMFEGMTWSYMFQLLLSVNLQQLIIELPTYMCTDHCDILSTDPYQFISSEAHNNPDNDLNIIPWVAAKNIKYLEIPFTLFRTSIDFWLNLHSKCSAMKLKFYTKFASEIFSESFLEVLLNHRYIVDSLKAIDICNNEMNCAELRKSLSDVMRDNEFLCDSKGHYFIII